MGSMKEWDGKKERRKRIRNNIWDGPGTHVAWEYASARTHGFCPACKQDEYFNDPKRTAEDMEAAMPSAWEHICK